MQQIQDLLNECGIILGSDIQMQYMTPIIQTKLNGTTEIV